MIIIFNIIANGMIYCSGCLGVDPEIKALVPGGVGPQARQVLTNMKNVLEAGGSSMSKVVKCTVLLQNMSDFAEVNGIYAEFFPESPPARATFAGLFYISFSFILNECYTQSYLHSCWITTWRSCRNRVHSFSLINFG